MDSKYIVTKVISGNAGVSVTVRTADAKETQTFLVDRKFIRFRGISEGTELDSEVVDELTEQAELCRAEARAIKIISYSDHSVQALVRKLISYGFSEDVARRSAEETVKKGYLNEKEQASRCADYFLRHKYWGKKRIAMELLSRGYTRESINCAISAIDDSMFDATVEKLVEKKSPMPPRTKEEKDALLTVLSRMGYSISEITRAMAKVYGD